MSGQHQHFAQTEKPMLMKNSNLDSMLASNVDTILDFNIESTFESNVVEPRSKRNFVIDF